MATETTTTEDVKTSDAKSDAKNTSLTESITNAQTSADGAKEKEPEAKTEDKQEEPPKEKQEDKYNLNELEQEQARQLFTALKDPEKAPIVLDFLAKQAGYTKAETKQEQQEIKKDIVATLKEALGADLEYVAEKIGPVIKQFVEEQLTEKTADIRKNIKETELSKLETEASLTMAKIAKDIFKADEIPDNIMVEMNKMMDKFPPPEGMSVSEYVENIYFNVAGRMNIKPVDKVQEVRREKNRNDAPSRLASGVGKNAIPGEDAGKFTTLDAAVRAAAEAVMEK